MGGLEGKSMPMDSFSSEGILRRLIRLPYLPLYVGVLNAAVELDVFSGLTQRKEIAEDHQSSQYRNLI